MCHITCALFPEYFWCVWEHSARVRWSCFLVCTSLKWTQDSISSVNRFFLCYAETRRLNDSSSLKKDNWKLLGYDRSILYNIILYLTCPRFDRPPGTGKARALKKSSWEPATEAQGCYCDSAYSYVFIVDYVFISLGHMEQGANALSGFLWNFWDSMSVYVYNHSFSFASSTHPQI